MSRSYRKNPIVKDPDSRGYKKLFNRKLRRCQIDNDLLPQGSDYRKMNNPWDIHDYAFYFPLRYALDLYNDEDSSKVYRDWKRKYFSK